MRVFVTGSATGLGCDTASSLLDDGHQVIGHVRSEERRSVVGDLTERGAAVVIGDLADSDQTLDIVRQITSRGAVDAIIHKAGVIGGHSLLAGWAALAHRTTSALGMSPSNGSLREMTPTHSRPADTGTTRNTSAHTRRFSTKFQDGLVQALEEVTGVPLTFTLNA